MVRMRSIAQNLGVSDAAAPEVADTAYFFSTAFPNSFPRTTNSSGSLWCVRAKSTTS